MDQAAITMIENLHKKTGKTLDEWVKIVREEHFEKHGQIIKFLKEEYKFTHGFANLVAMKARKSDAGSEEDKDLLIEAQYRGKEHFRELYDALMSEIKTFGEELEIAPKKAYVSLRRKKQFAMLQPATKSRFEISLNLKGEELPEIAEPVTKANAMCSHVIKITSKDEVTDEIIGLLKKAWQAGG